MRVFGGGFSQHISSKDVPGFRFLEKNKIYPDKNVKASDMNDSQDGTIFGETPEDMMNDLSLDKASG